MMWRRLEPETQAKGFNFCPSSESMDLLWDWRCAHYYGRDRTLIEQTAVKADGGRMMVP